MANSANISVPLETLKHTIAGRACGKVENEKQDSRKVDINDVKKSCESDVTDEAVSSSSNKSHAESSSSRSKGSTFSTSEDKQLNGVKQLHSESKFTALDSSLPLNPDWTVTSDSQIWLECCQYNNTFRAYGGNVRSFQPSSSKVNSNQAAVTSNQIFSSQTTIPCPQIHRDSSTNSMNYNRNSQYIVHLHVNPGETISFDMGDHVQLIQVEEDDRDSVAMSAV
ncbi:uncharacterized protein LOC118197304 [Stegodyphus dumicola]|uniref:uncharacterized protein LOC118197304 n=1 Tax=Stegodyphus dumicola TaxID=202533 RepID=UPI0015A9B765|nr:uncharacterized protein LOC118197304 [Stegodyphus dumicola]